MLISLLSLAIVLITVGVVGKIIELRYKIDTIVLLKTFAKTFEALKRNDFAIQKTTGVRRLVLLNHGKNKATVKAMLRQITGIDSERANSIINSAPSTIMTNVTEDEAIMTKKALEFVGADCEVV